MNTCMYEVKTSFIIVESNYKKTNKLTQSSVITITVNLTVDAGNTGYTQIYYPLVNSGSLSLRQTLTATGTTTFTIPTGNQFYVATVQQSRTFDYQVAEVIFKINGTPDAGSPYIQTNLGQPAQILNVPLY